MLKENKTLDGGWTKLEAFAFWQARQNNCGCIRRETSFIRCVPCKMERKEPEVMDRLLRLRRALALIPSLEFLGPNLEGYYPSIWREATVILNRLDIS